METVRKKKWWTREMKCGLKLSAILSQCGFVLYVFIVEGVGKRAFL
jgi:hypothetical protein